MKIGLFMWRWNDRAYGHNNDAFIYNTYVSTNNLQLIWNDQHKCCYERPDSGNNDLLCTSLASWSVIKLKLLAKLIDCDRNLSFQWKFPCFQ